MDGHGLEHRSKARKLLKYFYNTLNANPAVMPLCARHVVVTAMPFAKPLSYVHRHPVVPL